MNDVQTQPVLELEAEAETTVLDDIGMAEKPERWARLRAYDTAILLRVGQWRVRWATPIMSGFTALGNTESWFLHGLMLVVLLGQPDRHLLLLGCAAVLATIASQILKRLFRRPRPSVTLSGFEPLHANPDEFSFPSGHTTVAFAVATALMTESSELAAFEFTLAGGIAVSRLYLGAHYPIDVGAGIGLGILCGFAVRLAIFGA